MVATSARDGLRQSSLATGVVAAALAVCVLFVGLDGWRSWQARTTQIAEDKVETANLARSLAQQAHDTIQAADTALVALRQAVEVHGITPVTLPRLHLLTTRLVAALPVVHGLAVFDAAGHWVVGSRPAGSPPLDNANRAYFRYHRSHTDRGVHVGDPIHSRADGDWIITVSRRLDAADGSFAGLVLATITVNSLQRFYATFDVGERGLIALDSAAGAVLARQPIDDAVIGKSVAASTVFRELLPRSPVGSFRLASPIDGVVRIGSYRRVDHFPLVVVVAHSVDEVLADWRAEALFHLAISLSAAIVVAWLGSRFARLIKARQQMEQRYRLLADNSSDAIFCVGMDGERRYVSPAFATLTGWTHADAVGVRWGHFVHPDDRPRVLDITRHLQAGATQVTCSYRYVCKDGAHLWVEGRFHLVPATEREGAQFVGVVRDISERKAAEEHLAAINEQLAAQASTDGLTGLANRRRFDETLEQEWRRAAREAMPLSLLLIDVDRFKAYNDSYGHLHGDHCLRMVAGAIADCAQRPGDLAARYGGEEIAVVLPATEAAGADGVAERVRAAIEALGLEHAGNAGGVVTASVGVATLMPRPDGAEAKGESLIAAADAALYEAKRSGRNRVVAGGATALAGPPPVLSDEPRRLAVLARYEQAGAAAAADSLDRLARLTASLFDVPIALVSLVGRERQCFPGRVGLAAEGTARDVSFCTYTIAGAEVFTVADALSDARFANNPLVRGEPHIRFYAGAPLVSPLGGQHLGALCIIDHVPRAPLTSSQKALLTDLAALAVSHMEQRRRDAEGGLAVPAQTDAVAAV